MKLLRYGQVGHERPGIVDSQGRIRSLWPAVQDLTPDIISPEGMKILKAFDPERLPLVDGNPRIGVPVTGIRQFFAIGLNYKGHIAEAGLPPPEEPLVFTKALTSLCGPDDDIVLPKGSRATDWEVEMGVVIGREAHNVSESEALTCVAGYCAANDVSERDWQMKPGGPGLKSKSAPTFGPLGPWLVTTDELPDPQAIELALDVNGMKRQRGNTADMVFDVRQIVSHISQVLTLLPGDVILTGTPAGVGSGMKPPVYLKPGDVVTIASPQLGRQRQAVRPQSN